MSKARKKPVRNKRAPKFDEVKREKYLSLRRKGLTHTNAAHGCGVSRWTVADHRAKDPEFNEQVTEAEAYANGVVENRLFKKTELKNSAGVTASLAWLYSRCPDRWADKRNIQHSGGLQVNHTGTVTVYIPENGREAESRIPELTHSNGHGNGEHLDPTT